MWFSIFFEKTFVSLVSRPVLLSPVTGRKMGCRNPRPKRGTDCPESTIFDDGKETPARTVRFARMWRSTRRVLGEPWPPNGCRPLTLAELAR
jgi:hypothetical protein